VLFRSGFDEAKESLGTALLPFVEKFITFLNDVGIPALNAFIAGLTGDEGLTASINETGASFYRFGQFVSFTIDKISSFITFLREAIGLVVSLANEMIRVVNIIPGVNIGALPNPAPSARVPAPRLPNGGYTTGGGVTNITVNAIDGEGAARAVAGVLNQSAARSAGLLVGGTVGR
jgi:hypothetical protein